MAPSGTRGRLDRHIDFLGRLHLLWALFNGTIAVGVACFAVAAGVIAASARREQSGAEFAAGVTAGGFLALASIACIWAVIHWWCGQSLLRHDHAGRLYALALAVGNAFLVPLGTAFAGYTLWVLLQEDARVAFELTNDD